MKWIWIAFTSFWKESSLAPSTKSELRDWMELDLRMCGMSWTERLSSLWTSTKWIFGNTTLPYRHNISHFFVYIHVALNQRKSISLFSNETFWRIINQCSRSYMVYLSIEFLFLFAASCFKGSRISKNKNSILIFTFFWRIYCVVYILLNCFQI